jgi:hypothetical protein
MCFTSVLVEPVAWKKNLLEKRNIEILGANRHDCQAPRRAAMARDAAALERPLGAYLNAEPPEWMQSCGDRSPLPF